MTPRTAPAHQLVTEDVRDVAVVRLNRPEKLNALTPDMLRGLAVILRDLVGSQDVRGIVLTGAGRAFSAGEDLDGVDIDQESLADIDLFQDITYAVLETQVPVIAAINGIAVGGAAEMTLACDVRLGSSGAEYFFPENGLGLTISNGSSRLLPRLVGPRALRIVLDARRLNAEEALALGLLDEVVAGDDELVEEAVSLARRWSEPGTSTREHLALLRPSLDELEPALERERTAARAAWARGATIAGVEAFRGRRRDPA